MPQVSNDGVKISYDVAGEGRPLILLHGWVCDRSEWTEPGHTDALRRGLRVINVDLRGHGDSDKPHDPSAYRIERMTADVLAVADAEGIRPLCHMGSLVWRVDRVDDGVFGPKSSGGDHQQWFLGSEAVDRGVEAVRRDVARKGIRRGGMQGLLDVIEEEEGEAFSSEYPQWAQAVVLRADPEAALASQSAEAWEQGIRALEVFPVPTLLIAGEREDEDDEVACCGGHVFRTARACACRGLGHAGAAMASDLTVPTARTFLDRWFL